MSVNSNDAGITKSRPNLDDEIDLFELWENIWSQRYLVMIITFIVVILGASYAFLSKPIYKSEIFLQQPLSKDIQELQINVEDFTKSPSFNVGVSTGTANNTSTGTGIELIDAEKTFERVVQNLRSLSLRNTFYQNNDLAIYFSKNPTEQATNSLFEDNFNSQLKITPPSTNDQDNRYIVSFKMTDRTRAAEWLNAFVSFSLQKTKLELIDDVQSNINQRKKELKMMISSMRNIAAEKRQDRLAELEEALALAKNIGLENIQQSQSPIPEKEYLRGTKALEAEMAVLKQRKSDDPFIEGIRDLQRYHDYLDSIKINAELIQVARIDQEASIPESPIKPHKKLILVLSLVLGGMVGIFVALIRTAIKNRREINTNI